ncbi:MAG: OmpA family protein [Candidatus Omnitrophota bacterium]
MVFKKTGVGITALLLVFSLCLPIYSQNLSREESKRQQLEEMQKDFEWWPTDSTPGPKKDSEREGYWWWPTEPGAARPWGNRGYVYVYKIIFDYKEEELPPPEPQELRPSLLIKKIIKNVKIYFDYDSAGMRDDAAVILEDTVMDLRKNPQADILITGNCDQRGSEKYNEKLGRRRAETVQNYMRENGIPEESIRIISRGKLDAAAPLADLVGMQKDRNAHFVIAEVEEVMIPYSGGSPRLDAEKIGEGKYLVEEEKKIEGEVRVDSREYVIKKGDTLSKIAQEQLGKAHRWKYLYELNKDVIKDPNKLKPGKKIMIPIE